VLITTRLCDRGRSIEVAIADSGCGIEAGHLERVFQPFVTSKPEGLGLGLVICRWIAQAHRGRLWAEDAAGGGAVLRLRLPVRC
jgi:two-component system sensor kinase FixL